MTILMVGIADLKIGRDPDVVTTLGLGSCVGITMYDPGRRIGGLVHIMLPEFNGQMDHNPHKFADTGIQDLLDKLIRAGARRANLVAKLAGGAHMFSGAAAQNFLKIGERNVAISNTMLHKLQIPVIAHDTGGTHGRTIELHTDSGKLKIKTVGYGEKFI